MFYLFWVIAISTRNFWRFCGSFCKTYHRWSAQMFFQLRKQLIATGYQNRNKAVKSILVPGTKSRPTISFYFNPKYTVFEWIFMHACMSNRFPGFITCDNWIRNVVFICLTLCILCIFSIFQFSVKIVWTMLRKTAGRIHDLSRMILQSCFIQLFLRLSGRTLLILSFFLQEIFPSIHIH